MLVKEDPTAKKQKNLTNSAEVGLYARQQSLFFWYRYSWKNHRRPRMWESLENMENMWLTWYYSLLHSYNVTSGCFQNDTQTHVCGSGGFNLTSIIHILVILSIWIESFIWGRFKVIHKEYSRFLNQFFPTPCLYHKLNMIIYTSYINI